MSFEEAKDTPGASSGTVRLFPLPNLVMFPHVLQPLHVFEPRYVDMLEDALADDRLIAMTLLAPGWETDYEGRPPVYPVGCLGRVATHQKLKDGRYNLLLHGVCRVIIVRELEPAGSFRQAEAEYREDYYPPEGEQERARLRARLVEQFKEMLPPSAEAQEPLSKLLGGKIPLGVLTDVVAYTLDIELALKEQLLAELNVDRRARLLLDQLIEAAGRPPSRWPGGGKFPPGFSDN